MLRYRSINQILFALFLLAIGVVLLLVNIGVISLEIMDFIVYSYPFFFLAIGISMLFGNLLKKRNDLFFSSFVVLFFSLLVLDRFHVIDFGFWDIWKLWPVLIILFAFSILFKKRSLRIHFTNDLASDMYKKGLDGELLGGRKKVRGLTIGDISFKENNWALEPMELYNTIGDYFIDFNKAYIPEKETSVTLKGWIGDVKMIIPEGVPVSIQANIKVGDIRIFDHKSEAINRYLEYETPGYDEATRKLKIMIELKIGSIRIDKV
ncbi:cell wall-active antibiotics response protein LiaF [Robertmurraya andreesenii]|uniref:Lia operon protein LiaF n=1 Tax=Anoxybacillus andreesenii TaxID=1325932 RepID=A0ABT9UYJ8_9BACL|nr:cell wall-active antibiotics response protein LiaF [Robertmurraya andreesenii]MDQ0153761.1 lia operon protein LiaF [Robertmurraya andreesenii]